MRKSDRGKREKGINKYEEEGKKKSRERGRVIGEKK
jgi:hypothetical protein